MHSQDELQARWPQLKAKVRVMWGRLTSDEVEALDGRRARLEAAIKRAYQRSNKQITREVDDFCSSRGLGIDRAA